MSCWNETEQLSAQSEDERGATILACRTKTDDSFPNRTVMVGIEPDKHSNSCPFWNTLWLPRKLSLAYTVLKSAATWSCSSLKGNFQEDGSQKRVVSRETSDKVSLVIRRGREVL